MLHAGCRRPPQLKVLPEAHPALTEGLMDKMPPWLTFCKPSCNASTVSYTHHSVCHLIAPAWGTVNRLWIHILFFLINCWPTVFITALSPIVHMSSAYVEIRAGCRKGHCPLLILQTLSWSHHPLHPSCTKLCPPWTGQSSTALGYMAGWSQHSPVTWQNKGPLLWLSPQETFSKHHAPANWIEIFSTVQETIVSETHFYSLTVASCSSLVKRLRASLPEDLFWCSE